MVMACVMTEALDYPSIHVPVQVHLILDNSRKNIQNIWWLVRVTLVVA